MNFFYTFLYELFTDLEFTPLWADVVSRAILFLLIIFLSFFVGWLCKKVLIPVIQKLREKTPTKYDDYLLSDEILYSMGHIIPPFLIYLLLPFAFKEMPVAIEYLQRAGMIYIIIMIIRLIYRVIDSLFSISRKKKSKKNIPLRGIAQMLKIVTTFLCVIWIIGTLLGKDPLGLIAGLGAAATVLTFIFKDSLVGLIAGIQLSSNDMVKPGDWITVPGTAVDGEVQDVTLTTVKVRNFDNTILTIPPNTLVTGSFQNWRGMQESGVRRVSRSIMVDMGSIHFCTPEEIEQFTEAGFIEKEEDTKELVNTTLYTRYLEKYMKSHPYIKNTLICMARTLQPVPEGMPIQLYFFSIKNEWVSYEHIQSQVISYAISAAPQFNLRICQSPLSDDIKNISQTINQTTQSTTHAQS